MHPAFGLRERRVWISFYGHCLFFFTSSQMRQKILEHWKDLRREDEWSSPSVHQYSLFLRIPMMQNFPLVAATPEQ